MGSIETLKKELIEQKKQVEIKGGVVSVANDYPAPSEITEGIKTIVGSDFTIATATEADVMLGKTFYAGSAGLKTGTGSFDPEMVNHLFVVPEYTRTTEQELYFSFPSNVTKARKCLFYRNSNSLHITFHSDITLIEEYAFYGTTNSTFYNFTDMANLTKLSNYSFYDSALKGINLWDYPAELKTVDGYVFQNAIKEDSHITDIKIPSTFTTLGHSAYRQSERRYLNSLNVESCRLTAFSDYIFYNISFNCDMRLPSTVKEVGDYFNYGGNFNNITFPVANVILRPYCFGALQTDALSLFKLKTVTFEGTTVGTIGSRVFAEQNITNGFKIYVPDEAVDYYKAISNLALYVSCIYPMSEKD